MKKMPKTQILEEQRISFPCEVCGSETLPSRKIEVIAHMNNLYHISEWRICPIREKEKGCGHWQLFNYKISEEEMKTRQQSGSDSDESDNLG